MNPDFDNAGTDWRNYIGKRTAALWDSFTVDQRLALAKDADLLTDGQDLEP